MSWNRRALILPPKRSVLAIRPQRAMLPAMVRVFLFLLVVSSLGCGRVRYDLAGTQPVEVPTVVAAGGEWIKDKGRKFDVRWWIQNRSNYNMVIYREDVQCHKGRVKGQLRGLERSARIEFGPGQERVFTLTCDTNGKTPGAFQMVMAQVFEDRRPEEDRLVARDLVWIIETE